MHSSTNRGFGFASHGIVLGIGLFGGLVLLDRHGPGLGLFAIFHAWRERDREAALACLGRSWRLLDELYVTSALLEREFGRDWMAQQLRDDQLPYRMRRTIASGLATHLAWDAGLAGFITCYQTITDSELKDRFWERFADEWRLEDPPEVARILTNDCPAAVRDKLLNDWAPPQGTFPDFSFHPPDPPTYATVEWFKQVRGSLDPSLVPDAIRDNECKPWWLEHLPSAKPESASLDETIKSNQQSHLTEGEI